MNIPYSTDTNVGGGPKVSAVSDNIFSPNVWVPGWVLEGITVYSESRLFNYQGRLNDGKYDAYIGARVAENRFPSILDATFNPHEFNLEGIYTYGGVFFNYLAQTYGEEKLTEFFTVHGSSWASLDKNTQTVFGKTFPQLWADWQAYEMGRFKDYFIDGQRVTTDGWYISNPLITAGDQGEPQLFYQRYDVTKTGPGGGFTKQDVVGISSQQEKWSLPQYFFQSTFESRDRPVILWVEDKTRLYNASNLNMVFMLSSGEGFALRKDRLVAGVWGHTLLPDGVFCRPSAETISVPSYTA